MNPRRIAFSLLAAVILMAKVKIEEFNKAFPCRENSVISVIGTKLDEALLWSMKRCKWRNANV
jgi:hypothetical protein